MDISTINGVIRNYGQCDFHSFGPDTSTVILGFEADGGPYETVQPKLIFDDVRVMHLPRVIHAAIQLRLATQDEAIQVIPPRNFDPEEGGQYSFLQSEGRDLGFYIWAASVRLEGVPANWPYHPF